MVVVVSMTGSECHCSCKTPKPAGASAAMSDDSIDDEVLQIAISSLIKIAISQTTRYNNDLNGLDPIDQKPYNRPSIGPSHLLTDASLPSPQESALVIQHTASQAPELHPDS